MPTNLVSYAAANLSDTLRRAGACRVGSRFNGQQYVSAASHSFSRRLQPQILNAIGIDRSPPIGFSC